MRTRRSKSASMLVAGLLATAVPTIAFGEARQASGPATGAPARVATAGTPASGTAAGAPAPSPTAGTPASGTAASASTSATTATAEGQKDPRPPVGLTVKNES